MAWNPKHSLYNRVLQEMKKWYKLVHCPHGNCVIERNNLLVWRQDFLQDVTVSLQCPETRKQLWRDGSRSISLSCSQQLHLFSSHPCIWLLHSFIWPWIVNGIQKIPPSILNTSKQVNPRWFLHKAAIKSGGFLRAMWKSSCGRRRARVLPVFLTKREHECLHNSSLLSFPQVNLSESKGRKVTT